MCSIYPIFTDAYSKIRFPEEGFKQSFALIKAFFFSQFHRRLVFFWVIDFSNLENQYFSDTGMLFLTIFLRRYNFSRFGFSLFCSERIVIKAPTSSGAFYAAQSLFALANKNEVGNTWSIPRADVKVGWKSKTLSISK